MSFQEVSAPRTEERAGYSIKEFCRQCSISPAYFYELKKARPDLIDTVKIGGKAIVLTAPRSFLESFR